MNALKTALRTRLTGTSDLTALLDGTASVYHLRAPRAASLPYVTFSYVTDEELNRAPGSERRYMIDLSGWAEDADTAAAIAVEIDDALATNLSFSGWGVERQWRERGTPTFAEEAEGKTYHREGSTWQVQLQQVS